MESLEQRRQMILASLEQDERTLRQAWVRLRADFNRRIDVVPRIQQQPMRWLAGAFAAGMLLGLIRR